MSENTVSKTAAEIVNGWINVAPGEPFGAPFMLGAYGDGDFDLIEEAITGVFGTHALSDREDPNHPAARAMELAIGREITVLCLAHNERLGGECACEECGEVGCACAFDGLSDYEERAAERRQRGIE